MATIVTRAGKGSALTFTEGDANFTNLNDDKIELADLSVGAEGAASGDGSISYDNSTGVFTYTPPDLSSYLTSYTETDPVVGAVTGIVKADGAGNITAAVSGTDYLASETFTELSQDTTPQLGGNLDVNSNSIVSTSNGDITLAPNGTGLVSVTSDLQVGPGDAEAVLTTNGSQNLVIDTNGGTTTGSITITAGANGNIELAPNGTGKVVLDNINYYETPYTLSYAATITPDVANGTVQIITLTGNVTFSAFSNPVAGQTLTLIVKQDATGSRTLTSTMKFADAFSTLSTAANSIDILSVFYDGTNYYASLSTDFQ